MGKGSAGLNKGTGIGIKPGGGKKANEFDELDEEDRRIVAANEAKAQAGIPPGADHPVVVSHKIKAVGRSELKAKLDTMTEEAKEEYLEKMARGEIDKDGEEFGSGEEEKKDDLGRPMEKPPWVDIPVDLKEVAWFRHHYRLRRAYNQNDPSRTSILRPLDDLSVRIDEFAKIDAVERAARYSARSKADKHSAAAKAAADKEEAAERIRNQCAMFELQAVHYSRSDFREMPELQRRLAIDAYFEEYASFARAVGSTKKRAPRGHVVTASLPLLVRLTKHDLYLAEEEERMERAMTHHGKFSKPFCALRDYLLFITVFLGFLYCGRSSDAYWLKTGLLSSLGGATTFDNLATTSQLFDYLKDEFLPASFPQQGPSETGELSCKQKQFLGDGVHVRIGNMRLRQIRVGYDEAPKRKWSSALLHKYSTCFVPEMFQDALGGHRCFRGWGYRPSGVGPPNQYKRNFRLQHWQSSEDLEAPSKYSVGTRMRFPGEGYVKVLGNRLDMATEDVEALEKHTWIDVQTRAIFLEFTLLNVPTSLVATGTFVVEYGAEGNVSPGAKVAVTSLYKHYRVLQQASQGFGTGTPLLAGLFLGLFCSALAWYLARHVMAIPSTVTCLSFAGVFGCCGGWWGCAFAFASSRNEPSAAYLYPGAEVLVYGLVLYQVYDELKSVRQAKERGDTALGYCFGDLFSSLQILNLCFFLTALCFRIAALSVMSKAAEGMEEALALPCFGDTVENEFNSQGTASGFTQTQASAWGAVPEGCWGKEVTASGGQAPTLTGPSKLDGYYNQGEIDYGACAFPSGSDQRVANACCAEVGHVNLEWVLEYDSWVDYLNAFNALFLFLRFFKFVRMFPSLSLFSETLTEAGKRLAHIMFIIALIMTGFSVAFHLGFGYQEDKYRDFFESTKTLFEMLLGNNDLGKLRLINPYLAPLFFYAYVLVMVMVVLSMFVAVVNSSYEDSRELLSEPHFCFVRDVLWQFAVDAETLLPVYNQAEVYQALNLSKAFQSDSSVYTLGDADKLKLKQALDILADNCEEKDGASPLLLVELRRADGETSQGVATSLVVRNTDRLRSGLRYARGLDAQDLVDDLVHLYWTFLQIGPLRWLLTHTKGPGKWLRYLLPTVKGFKLWFDGGHEPPDLSAKEEEKISDEDEQTGQGGGKDDGSALVKVLQPLRNTEEDDAILRKLGLSASQIGYLHKVEEPKLSLMRELTGLEQGQRALLAAIDLLTKRSKDLGEAHGALEEERGAAKAADAKRKREEEADAKADQARKELLTRD